MIAVLDYGIGNLRSAEKALEFLGADVVLTDDPGAARAADAVVLPGVGAFGACMRALLASGLEGVVRESIGQRKPFLGICVGMHMLFEGSDESPETPGLGVLRGRVQRMPEGVKLPHMGWNTLAVQPRSAMFVGFAQPSWVYFVHSYAPVPTDDSVVSARCDHGGSFVAAVEDGRLWATQFHPEKSGLRGLGLLRNFVNLASSSASSVSRPDA